MKVVIGLLAALVLCGLSATAQAQPRGSYLRSCWGVSVRGDRLYATCRRADGRPQRTMLRDFRRCIGDIANINGTLRCRRAAGPPLPPPPPPFWQEHRRECERLRHRERQVRERLERTPYWDQDRRARLQHRLRELRGEYRRERCWRR